jgi:exonuclease III
MFNFFILLFFIFIKNIFGETECPIIKSNNNTRKTNNSVRLVQYNVEWLFIDYYSNMDCPGNGCSWKNETEANIHMEYVSNVIGKLNPDIINLCEVEGCDELNILNNLLNNTYNTYLKKGTDTGTGQNVGMLTKIDPLVNLFRSENKYNYPIKDSMCGYTGQPGTTGVSKHFITEFLVNNINIVFISAHLLAIPTDPARCAQREGQASILQKAIYDYVNKDYEIILIGDFNDYDNEILDVNNNKPNSQVLDILKGIRGEYANTYTLYSVGETVPQDERYSDWWDSDNNCNTSSIDDYSMIDHILVTNLIKKNIINTFIYHGYNEYCGKYNSDHYPLVVDLQF